jgi:hypothetical protein
VASLKDEEENDRPRSKGQGRRSKTPAERGFLSDGLSDGAKDDSAK